MAFSECFVSLKDLVLDYMFVSSLMIEFLDSIYSFQFSSHRWEMKGWEKSNFNVLNIPGTVT